MPICLPLDKAFKDTDRVATAVGLGITRENTRRGRCLTDKNGPVVFQRCSWAMVRQKPMDDYIVENYEDQEYSKYYPCRKDKTPSDNDPLCSNFYEEILELK